VKLNEHVLRWKKRKKKKESERLETLEVVEVASKILIAHWQVSYGPTV
jgi:hypothetical protein